MPSRWVRWPRPLRWVRLAPRSGRTTSRSTHTAIMTLRPHPERTYGSGLIQPGPIRESHGVGGELGGSVPFGRPAVGLWLERHRVAGWVVGLATAASLVLGIVLGRDAGPAQPGETGIAPSGPTVVAEPGTEVAVPPLAEARPAPLGEVPEPEPQVVVASVVPSASPVVEPGTVAAQGESGEFVERVAEDTPSERPVVLPSPVRSRQDYTTTRHLDRAATLLTAFRIDQRSPASEEELANWARGLLIDTRMHLDMPVNRSPLERALLEGPGIGAAPDLSAGPRRARLRMAAGPGKHGVEGHPDAGAGDKRLGRNLILETAIHDFRRHKMRTQTHKLVSIQPSPWPS